MDEINIAEGVLTALNLPDKRLCELRSSKLSSILNVGEEVSKQADQTDILSEMYQKHTDSTDVSVMNCGE